MTLGKYLVHLKLYMSLLLSFSLLNSIVNFDDAKYIIDLTLVLICYHVLLRSFIMEKYRACQYTFRFMVHLPLLYARCSNRKTISFDTYCNAKRGQLRQTWVTATVLVIFISACQFRALLQLLASSIPSGYILSALLPSSHPVSFMIPSVR